ncbi:anti-sigma factor antagonist [bacterium]|nr:anti-sigma factor antagonist [bacterium]
MSKLKINVRSHKIDNCEVQIVDVGGFLDAHTVPQLESTLNAFFKIEQYQIILNMVDLQYISSAGLGLLVVAKDEIENNKGSFFIVNLSPGVHKVFDISGCTKIFQILQQEYDALNEFEKNKSEKKEL